MHQGRTTRSGWGWGRLRPPLVRQRMRHSRRSDVIHLRRSGHVDLPCVLSGARSGPEDPGLREGRDVLVVRCGPLQHGVREVLDVGSGARSVFFSIVYVVRCGPLQHGVREVPDVGVGARCGLLQRSVRDVPDDPLVPGDLPGTGGRLRIRADVPAPEAPGQKRRRFCLCG